MPELRPFRALRYGPDAGDMSALLAPPYDVIDDEQAAALRARSPLNCVRLILPEGEAPSKYDRAADTLAEWVGGRLILQDPAAAAYVYRQTFDVHGGRLERTALFCALRLSPFGEGHVLPHEKTHSGPKRDRLSLTLATRTQLSPVFLIARDRSGDLYRSMAAACELEPAFETTTPDGTRHALVVVDDPDAVGALCAAGGREPLLIADGHHRYETALAVSDTLCDNVKAAFLLVCVVSQQDPGLIVQPTHRVLSDPPAGGSSFDWQLALADRFSIRDLGHVSPGTAESLARERTDGAMVVLSGSDQAAAWLIIPRPEALAAVGVSGERRHLAPVIFDSLVLRAMYRLDADRAAREGVLSYAREAKQAVSAMASGGRAFVLPPVSLEDVWSTTVGGGRLPPKSTYFEPKIPSGLVFRSLR